MNIISSIWHFRTAKIDKDAKINVFRCDLCDSLIPEAPEDLQYQIDKIDEINNSFESAYDKQEPKLLLCNQCQKEYDIPSWIK
jgi:uncharacterized protein with PIN domain